MSSCIACVSAAASRPAGKDRFDFMFPPLGGFSASIGGRSSFCEVVYARSRASASYLGCVSAGSHHPFGGSTLRRQHRSDDFGVQQPLVAPDLTHDLMDRQLFARSTLGV